MLRTGKTRPAKECLSSIGPWADEMTAFETIRGKEGLYLGYKEDQSCLYLR
jgi:hypothetical protein